MFAQVPPPTPANKGQLLQSSEFYIAVGILAGILLIGAVVIHFVDRWRRQQIDTTDLGRETTLDLTAYREMYENGEITRSEYERIRNKIAAKMKQEVGLTGPPAAPPAQPPDPPEPPPADGSPQPPAAG